jgi:hypothetical protein
MATVLMGKEKTGKKVGGEIKKKLLITDFIFCKVRC